MSPRDRTGRPGDLQTDADSLINILLDLRIDFVRRFMRERKLSSAGTRDDLCARLEDALFSRAISGEHVVDFLDEVEPWNKQHVFLYTGEDSIRQPWRRRDHVQQALAQADQADLLDQRLRIGLPDHLQLSTVRYSVAGILEVVAVEGRVHEERDTDKDRHVREEGELYLLKAYRQIVSRALYVFRWNTAANVAALHISQGFGRYPYVDAARRFGDLISPWLPFNQFGLKDIRKVVERLRSAEQAGKGEVRSNRVSFHSRGGRKVEASSASRAVSVVGEKVIDQAMSEVAGASSGRLGDFFWLPGTGPAPLDNPLTREAHVLIIADESRANFAVPTNEETINYVLRRIRALS